MVSRGPAALVVALAIVCADPGSAQQSSTSLVKSGTLEITQTQVALFYSGSVGGGKLHFQGKTYPFSVGGLGVGGIGASRLEAIGQVYNLKSVKDFPGAYGQVRYGFAAGDTSGGTLWLQNTNGVVLEIKGKRQGLALNLGADAVYFGFK